MKRKVFVTSVWIGFTVFAVVISGEILLRFRRHELTNFDNYFVKYHQSNTASCLFTFDENLGWVSEPNVKERWNDYRTRVSTLDHGIRANSPTNPVKEGLTPFLVVGDSFAFGDQVSNEETWASALESKIGERVINGAVCAYGMDQTFLRAKQLVEIYKPTTLLFGYTGYDISRTVQKNYPGYFSDDKKPYFEKENGEFVLKGVPIAKSPGVHELELPLVHKVVGRSTFLSFLFSKMAPDYWWSVKLADRLPSSTEENDADISCHIMKLLSDLSRSKNIRTVVVSQPFFELEAGNIDALEKVNRCARENSLEVLDLTPSLLELKSKDLLVYDTFYFSYRNFGEKVGHGNMTAAGNEFVAEQIRQYLTKK